MIFLLKKYILKNTLFNIKFNNTDGGGPRNSSTVSGSFFSSKSRGACLVIRYFIFFLNTGFNPEQIIYVVNIT